MRHRCTSAGNAYSPVERWRSGAALARACARAAGAASRGQRAPGASRRRMGAQHAGSALGTDAPAQARARVCSLSAGLERGLEHVAR
eukprot:5755715-Alexandrium_andersonii.AAC.1